MKYCITTCIFYLFSFHCFSQYKYVYFGIGNIEYLHLGVNSPMAKNKISIQTSIGAQPIGKNKIVTFNNRVVVPFFAFKVFQIPLETKVSLSTFLWSYNNAYNQFINLSLGPELHLKNHFKNNKNGITLCAGIMYNNVLLYKRKTYEEVGWPTDWIPSFSLTIFHLITR